MNSRVAGITILAALAVAGCDAALDRPTGPLDMMASAAKGKSGGSTSGSMTVSESGAIATAGPAVFEIWSDNGRRLSGGTTGTTAALAFTASRDAALADPASCSVAGNRNLPVAPALVLRAIGKLVSPEMTRALSLAVDKTALGMASPDHDLGGTWQDADGLFDIGVGTVQKSGDPVTAELLSGDLATGTSLLRYHGGSVSIKDRSGSASFSVTCPNLDAVDATLTR